MRTIVAGVVGVRAVENDTDAQFRQHALQLRIELVLQ